MPVEQSFSEKHGLREMILRCDCGVHVADFSFYVTPENADDFGEFGYVTFGTLYQDDTVFSFWNLKQRLKGAWDILRGKRHYYTEVVLDNSKTAELALFLSRVVEEAQKHQEMKSAEVV